MAGNCPNSAKCYNCHEAHNTRQCQEWAKRKPGPKEPRKPAGLVDFVLGSGGSSYASMVSGEAPQKPEDIASAFQLESVLSASALNMIVSTRKHAEDLQVAADRKIQAEQDRFRAETARHEAVMADLQKEVQSAAEAKRVADERYSMAAILVRQLASLDTTDSVAQSLSTVSVTPQSGVSVPLGGTTPTSAAGGASVPGPVVRAPPPVLVSAGSALPSAPGSVGSALPSAPGPVGSLPTPVPGPVVSPPPPAPEVSLDIPSGRISVEGGLEAAGGEGGLSLGEESDVGMAEVDELLRDTEAMSTEEEGQLDVDETLTFR